MTKENYTTLSNEELLRDIKNIDVYPNKLNLVLRNHYSKLYIEVVNRTKFLDDFYTHGNVPILARLYCLEYHLESQPTCKHPDCNNHTLWDNHIRNFVPYCCMKHRSSDPKWQEKYKNTMMKRHGVHYMLESKENRQIAQAICEMKYGDKYPIKLDYFKQKVKETCNRKYGVDNPMQSEIVKEHHRTVCMNNWGVENPFQSPIVQDRFKETCNDRYGYEYFAQSPLSHTFHKKRIFHDNFYFDSNWEVLVYDYLKENHIVFEYSPEISLPYEYDGRTFYYHPDFLINGKSYEVKGEQFFKVDESGKEVMFNPYRNSEWSDEQYAWVCGKYEAKHQCMLVNGVIILRGSDIKELENAKSGETITFLQISNHNQ